MLVAVVIPTYNDRDSIPPLLQALLDLALNVYVVVVDDSSPDGTGQILDGWHHAYSQVVPIHRPRKLGLGTAHIAGMREVLALEPIL